MAGHHYMSVCRSEQQNVFLSMVANTPSTEYNDTLPNNCPPFTVRLHVSIKSEVAGYNHGPNVYLSNSASNGCVTDVNTRTYVVHLVLMATSTSYVLIAITPAICKCMFTQIQSGCLRSQDRRFESTQGWRHDSVVTQLTTRGRRCRTEVVPSYLTKPCELAANYYSSGGGGHCGNVRPPWGSAREQVSHYVSLCILHIDIWLGHIWSRINRGCFYVHLDDSMWCQLVTSYWYIWKHVLVSGGVCGVKAETILIVQSILDPDVSILTRYHVMILDPDVSILTRYHVMILDPDVSILTRYHGYG